MESSLFPGAAFDDEDNEFDWEAAVREIDSACQGLNVPLRDYQFSITKTALFSNTLVALPTGLGKTLIAAVVMYNYFRWFPGGKIVFAAPSRPLVMQQIEACHNTVGIPQVRRIPKKRSQFWKSKRVFFVTPQVLEKDILSGICPVKQLICLVIDEAHRAMGNYSYCVALMTLPVQLRVLALTATPGSKQKTIQNVIDNLHISTLEYRNENDNDVSPYIHSRKLELIEVSMCKQAVAINNFLLETIRPFASRLCNLGCFGLSPCELLNSRDKFRQAPPSNLPLPKYGEVEGYFGVLITLYHIRKLLSSHGIRPAYDMLEDKLKQGSFARLMSRNEIIWDAKRLMQQSLSHGAPNPKLEKMKEKRRILSSQGQSSFQILEALSNMFRDIMNSLSDMGEVVNATEFIGQSSGKALKGQTQKVQQAVLQRFRAGGYNVIVATSIGEEGLDIMEVDLVICFDANISPLRMIQRMGRTGRKHDGRCLSIIYFSPGPHTCRPQAQFVELSIEQFVPRGRKMGDGLTCRSPFAKEISKEEKCLIARIHRVRHSYKTTGMLIDAMQRLQGFSSFKANDNHSYEINLPSDQVMEIVTHGDNYEKDGAQGPLQAEDPESERSPNAISEGKDGRVMLKPDLSSQKTSVLHRFLFSEEFVTVNVCGGVSITSVPVLPFISESPCSKVKQADAMGPKCTNPDQVATSLQENLDSNEQSLHGDYETLLQIPIAAENPTRLQDFVEEEVPAEARKPPSVSQTSKTTHIIDDIELSPRLTHFIEKGIVPMACSAPTGIIDAPGYQGSHYVAGRIFESKIENTIPSSSIPEEAPEEIISPAIADDLPSILVSPGSPSSAKVPRQNEHGVEKVETSVHEAGIKCHSSVQLIEKTPVASHTKKGSSEGWKSGSAEALKSVHQTPKYKRLRRHRDVVRNLLASSWKKILFICQTVLRAHKQEEYEASKEVRGKGKAKSNPNNFVEDEAEVSSDARASEDEDDDSDESGYDDSFINDGTNSAEASARPENSGSDMMAFYRRSLLTQSPTAMRRSPLFPANSPDESLSPLPAETGSCSSGRITNSLQTPGNVSRRGNESPAPNSITYPARSRTLNLCENGETSRTREGKKSKMTEVRKKKLSFPHVDLDSAPNLRLEHPIGPESAQGQPPHADLAVVTLSDDDFYEGLDLDAVEAQAAELLRCKPEMPVGPTDKIDEHPDEDFAASPSFDLGIQLG
ncbi:unnamed protein product [Spirodela intermedia]|uniref:Uncharacterized protein n=1 Tax=Spirodela intermedia TaxID=51605 RepID=A0A7I8J3A5_SPIIN|nr:unnamed protein product [Spirodela intermedia]CAA6663830.1 unnamed protein product [Spirodela intermedia]